MIFLLILFGFIAGIFGGMGMGGGTVLVPLLSFLQLEQTVTQAANLISFLPMCVCALFFHNKNKLLSTNGVLWIIVPAVVSAVLGAFLIKSVEQSQLRALYGLFLLIVGIEQLQRTFKKENDFETTI